MKKEKSFVALTNILCPVCGKQCDSEILIHRRFGDISHLQNKNTGLAKDPCDSCAQNMVGRVAFIVCKTGTKPTTLYDAQRTGQLLFIPDSKVREFINDPALADQMIERRISFMEEEVLLRLGIPVMQPNEG